MSKQRTSKGGPAVPIVDNSRLPQQIFGVDRSEFFGTDQAPALTCPFRPLGARVVVRLLDEPQTGLIITPDKHKPRSQRGVVVAVGTGREYPTTGFRIPAGVSVGETVVFNRYADERFLFGKFGEDTLAAVSQEEILCVLDQD